MWSTFPPYTYDKGFGPVCAIKIDVFGITHIDLKRLWCSATMMTMFSNDIPWHRILGATRVRDKVGLWQNGNAQWNDLIVTGWLTKWIAVHSRQMDWAEGTTHLQQTHRTSPRKKDCAWWSFGHKEMVARNTV